MKAVVLAGGPGLRLRPLTLDRPAALLPVANRPLIAHLLEHLVRHRVTEATVCLHHRPDLLETYLGDGTRWGIHLRYSLERRLLGTGGAIGAAAARRSVDPVLVAFATALTTVDLAKATAFHQFHGAALTLIVAPVADGSGDVRLDDDAVVSTGEATGAAAYAFSGLAVLDPRVFSIVPAGVPADLIADVVPRLIAAGLAVHGYVAGEPGLLVRTPGELALANRRALIGDLPGLILQGFEAQPGIRICRGAAVHRTARLLPPVLVGTNAVIGRGATIEATIVGDDVIVAPASTIRNSVLLERTCVGRGLSLNGALVDRDRIHHDAAGAWVTVGDRRLLDDTHSPLWRAVGLVGRVLAAVLLVAASPAWVPLGAALTLETRGRPLRARRVVGARGDTRVWRVTVRGPAGRLVRRLGVVRGPYLWGIVRGDLHWTGTSICSRSEWDRRASRADLAAAPPGLVTLAQIAHFPLRRQERLALDRFYAATRTWPGDLRLVAASLRRWLGSIVSLRRPLALPSKQSRRGWEVWLAGFLRHDNGLPLRRPTRSPGRG
jgi:NDP-sugar pyrophosphorylase family protein